MGVDRLGPQNPEDRVYLQKVVMVGVIVIAGVVFVAPYVTGTARAVFGLDSASTEPHGTGDAVTTTVPNVPTEPTPVYSARGALRSVPPDSSEPQDAAYLRGLLGNVPGELLAGEATGPDGPSAAEHISVRLENGRTLDICVDLGAITLGSEVSQVACIDSGQG